MSNNFYGPSKTYVDKNNSKTFHGLSMLSYRTTNENE